MSGKTGLTAATIGTLSLLGCNAVTENVQEAQIPAQPEPWQRQSVEFDPMTADELVDYVNSTWNLNVTLEDRPGRAPGWPRKMLEEYAENDVGGKLKFLHETLGLHFDYEAEVYAIYCTDLEEDNLDNCWTNLLEYAHNVGEMLDEFGIDKVSLWELKRFAVSCGKYAYPDLSYYQERLQVLRDVGAERAESLTALTKAMYENYGVTTPGRARLFNEFGLVKFSSYTGQLIDEEMEAELVRNLDPSYRSEDPVALFLWTYNDLSSLDYAALNIFKPTMEHYKTYICQTNDPAKVSEYVKMIGSRKPIDLLVPMVHGMHMLMAYGQCRAQADSIGSVFIGDGPPCISGLESPSDFTEREDRVFLDITDIDEIASWGPYIAPDADIPLVSCWQGYGREGAPNMTNAFGAALPGRNVYSSVRPIEAARYDSESLAESVYDFANWDRSFDFVFENGRFAGTTIPEEDQYNILFDR